MENKKEITNPVKAIRAKCLECSNFSTEEVKNCPVDDCDLFAFRLGKNPYRKKIRYSDEQRALMTERLLKANAKRLEKNKCKNS